MKVPRSYHPLFVLLFGMFFAAAVFAVGSVVELPPDWNHGLNLPSIGVGLLLGLLWVGIEALQERAEGADYLRRQLLRRRSTLFGRYWLLRGLWWVLLFALGGTFGRLWLLGAVILGMGLAYPYWRGHWQRLQRVAQEETVAAESTTG